MPSSTLNKVSHSCTFTAPLRDGAGSLKVKLLGPIPVYKVWAPAKLATQFRLFHVEVYFEGDPDNPVNNTPDLANLLKKSFISNVRDAYKSAQQARVSHVGFTSDDIKVINATRMLYQHLRSWGEK